MHAAIISNSAGDTAIVVAAAVLVGVMSIIICIGYTVNLSGQGGFDALANLTNSSSNFIATPSTLWTWGGLPQGYTLDANGSLQAIPPELITVENIEWLGVI